MPNMRGYAGPVPGSVQPNWGGVWRLGSQPAAPAAPTHQTSGPRSSGYIDASGRAVGTAATPGRTQSAGTQQQIRSPQGPISVSSSLRDALNTNVVNRRTIPGVPQTGGGYQDGTQGGAGGGAGANAAMNALLDLERRERSSSRENQRGIMDQMAGLGRVNSAGGQLRRERQASADRITGLRHDFLAQQFASGERERQAQLEAQLRREQLAQELQMSQARLGFERESLQQRLAAEREQGELDRQNRIATASASGGGEGTRMSDLTGRRPGGYGGAYTNNYATWTGQTPSALQRGLSAGASAADAAASGAFGFGGGSTSSASTGGGGSSFRTVTDNRGRQRTYWAGYGA